MFYFIYFLVIRFTDWGTETTATCLTIPLFVVCTDSHSSWENALSSTSGGTRFHNLLTENSIKWFSMLQCLVIILHRRPRTSKKKNYVSSMLGRSLENKSYTGHSQDIFYIGYVAMQRHKPNVYAQLYIFATLKC